jgi:hypothetical protein
MDWLDASAVQSSFLCFRIIGGEEEDEVRVSGLDASAIVELVLFNV